MRDGTATGFRFLLVALFAAACLAMLFYFPQPPRFALAVTGGFTLALMRLRHVGLALAAALTPLPGILWSGTSAYAFCVAFAIVMAAACGEARLKEENPAAALWQQVPALAGALVFVGLWSLHAPVQLPELLGGSAAVLLCLPGLVLSVPFGEEAIARGNRQREALLRLSGFAARIAEPRWSLSFSGVGLVLALLGYFQISGMPPLFDGLAAGCAGVMIFALTRDGRAAVAALLAAALLLIFTAGVSGALLLFLLFALLLGRSAATWRGAGESVELAWARTIEDHGATFLFAGLAAMIAAGAHGGAQAALHAACGLIAALILFPAFTGALHHLFPRRRSVEELYRSAERRPEKV